MLPKVKNGALVEIVKDQDPIAVRDCTSVSEAIGAAMQLASISNREYTIAVIDSDGKCVLDLSSLQVEAPKPQK